MNSRVIKYPLPENARINLQEMAGEPKREPYPLHALNVTMRAIAEATAEVHQIPIELPAMAAVATMAGALGKSCELVGAVNGKTSFGNIYVIAGAPKSTGSTMKASGFATVSIGTSRGSWDAGGKMQSAWPWGNASPMT